MAAGDWASETAEEQQTAVLPGGRTTAQQTTAAPASPALAPPSSCGRGHFCTNCPAVVVGGGRRLRPQPADEGGGGAQCDACSAGHYQVRCMLAALVHLPLSRWEQTVSIDRTRSAAAAAAAAAAAEATHSLRPLRLLQLPPRTASDPPLLHLHPPA